MRVVPILVARPPKAKAVDVTDAPPEVELQAGRPCGSYRPVMDGPLEERRAALHQLLETGALTLDGEPGMFVYRVAHEGRRWVGLVCGADPAELAPTAVATVAGRSSDPAHAEVATIGWQVEPVLVQCDMPERVADLLVSDTNERPAYHFMATTGGTHSAWVIRDHSAYLDVLASATPVGIARGAHRVIAAHHAGHRVLVILTRDLHDYAALPPLLAPRCGLFVAPTNGRNASQ